MALTIPLVPKHLNNGNCPHCDLIINRYPGFYGPLKDWFKAFQAAHPEAHTSCAGRGYLDQENAFVRKVSRAHYGESAHNYNAALDIFELSGETPNIYERSWYTKTLEPNLLPWMDWYGRPGSPYPELPHVQPAQFKTLVKAGAVFLVETFGKIVPLKP